MPCCGLAECPFSLPSLHPCLGGALNLPYVIDRPWKIMSIGLEERAVQVL